MTRIEILHVPDCPGLPVLRQRLATVWLGAVATRAIETAEQAAGRGMCGSPTLLVDGVDPFAEPGAPASLSCRLYRDDTGRASNAPSVDQLRAALVRR